MACTAMGSPASVYGHIMIALAPPHGAVPPSCQVSCRECGCRDSPVCRGHHKCKQLPRWTLTQTSPGSFTWATPGGRAYRTTPAEYPP